MKPEAQLVALLEWMGWKLYESRRGALWLQYCCDQNSDPWRHLRPENRDSVRLIQWSQLSRGKFDGKLPPLTLDLMREAEMKFDEQTYRLFIGELVAILKPGEFSVRSTKEQRLEALLKTIGKWSE